MQVEFCSLDLCTRIPCRQEDALNSGGSSVGRAGQQTRRAIDYSQIKQRPHLLDILAHEHDIDDHGIFAMLDGSVGVDADGPVVATDGEGGGLKELADAHAVLEAVAFDGEDVRPPRRLRCANRRRLLAR